MKKFKDSCDNCNQMKFCRGYTGKLLCEECIKLLEQSPIEIIGDKNEQTRFNL